MAGFLNDNEEASNSIATITTRSAEQISTVTCSLFLYYLQAEMESTVA